MIKQYLMLLVLTITACSGISNENRRYAERIDGMALCPEERPQVCTLDYRPTCAQLEDGKRKEYANPCNACADPKVVGQYGKACAEL